LVHISELANRYIKDASDVVKAGQIVKVKVLTADPKTKRIALSMKALHEPPAKHPPKPQPKPQSKPQTKLQSKPQPKLQPKPKPQPKLELTFEEKVALLAAKWKTR